MALKFYTSIAKGLKLKAIKFFGLVRTFAEGTGEKLAGELFRPPLQKLFQTKLERNLLKKYFYFYLYYYNFDNLT